MTRIAVVDYGAGNLVSIEQALSAVGAEAVVVRDPAGLDGADGLVVPGVGAAAPAMERLAAAGLVEPILELDRVRAPVPRDLPRAAAPVRAERRGRRRDARRDRRPDLAHRGCTRRCRTSAGTRSSERETHPLFDGIADGADFYFVHSYAGFPENAEVELARTTHGGTFASAVAQGPILGVQFHPERSGDDGLRLLSNFLAIVRDPEPAAVTR